MIQIVPPLPDFKETVLKLIFVPFFVLLLSQVSGCSDEEARQSVNKLSNEIQTLKMHISALQAKSTEYADVQFKLEGFTYQFSQDEFNPVLNGSAMVTAIDRDSLPSLARVEVMYQVHALKGELLKSGIAAVSLTDGQGILSLKLLIPVMIAGTDDVRIHLSPHRWYPVYHANPAP